MLFETLPAGTTFDGFPRFDTPMTFYDTFAFVNKNKFLESIIWREGKVGSTEIKLRAFRFKI